ncbi:MAG: hypothetical protein KME27_13495 [Lyngbya sp. HA4199-MV5]|jgi:hypothetical protein|nr:hypothetical protein [Lyngbya sp. HA4199-MV5]
MQITLERSGGYTGIPITITVDTATLAPDNVNQLRRLVDAADFFHVPAPPSTPAQPDRFEYEITVQEGDRKHTIAFEEAAIPESLKPLVHWLVETARSH